MGTPRDAHPISPRGRRGTQSPIPASLLLKSRLCIFHVEIFSFSPFIPPFLPCPDYGASTGTDGDERLSRAHSSTGHHRGDRSNPRVPSQLHPPPHTHFFISPFFPLRSSLLPAGTGNTRVDVIGSGSPGREAQPSLPLLRPHVLWLCVGTWDHGDALQPSPAHSQAGDTQPHSQLTPLGCPQTPP